MNILRVTRAFPPRICGWSAHAKALSEQQASLGHSVRVMQPRSPSSEAGSLKLEYVERPSQHGGPAGHFADLVFNMRVVSAAVRESPRWRPDIIHVHGDIVDAAVQTRLGRRLGVPVVLTLHAGLNRRRRYRLLARPILSHVDGVIGVSASARDDAISLGVPPDRTTIISSGVDPKFAEPDPTARARVRSELGIPDDVVVTAFVGRLEPLKGVATLASAAARLNPRSHRVLVVGDGSERGYLADAGPALLHLGERSKREVLNVLRASDLFVMPSVDLPGQGEGTPTAILEALVVGLPLVVSNAGGIPNLIRDSAHGTIVPQNDPDRLARAIEALARSADIRRDIAERNRDLGRSFLWPSIATRVLAFYARFGLPSSPAPACSAPEVVMANSQP